MVESCQGLKSSIIYMVTNMSRPYSISLLNELHEHFPDLLYRSSRFRNVGDLLNYVISVAQRNPYTIAQEEYDRVHPRVPDVPNPTISVSMSRSTVPDAEFNRMIYGLDPRELEQPAAFVMRPRTASSVRRSTDPIMSFIGDLLGGSSGGLAGGLQSFLDQPVIVRPTTEQIDSHTTLSRSYQQQDDNCAICQDPIEMGQMMRIISHCTHRFHQDCIDTWFQSHVTCPTCRHDIREAS
jgi:hypothetical protein